MLNNLGFIQNWELFLLPYHQAVEELVIKFKAIKNQKIKNGEYSQIEHVQGRVKTVSSILEKANRCSYDIEKIEEKIMDIAGIRLKCQFEEDIQVIVEDIKSRDDMKVINIKDYLKSPKNSGYRSVHMIVSYRVHTANGAKQVFCEIQIRTLAMDFWSTIEHSLNYKYKGDIPTDIKNRLIIAAGKVNELDKEMSLIKEEIVQAQKAFRIRSSGTDLIMEYISLLKKLGYLQIAEKYIKIFTEVSQKDDSLQLLLLQKEIEREVQKIVDKK